MRAVLGVDIGGVIIDRVNDGTDTSFFSDNYLRTTAVPDAFVMLRRAALCEPFGGDRIHLVSKCGLKVAERTRQWLGHHQFFQFTGIPQDNLHFCRERWEKAPICQKLGVTHFVDDRLDVLGHLRGIVPHRFLFSPTWYGPTESDGRIAANVVVTRTWRNILDAIDATLPIHS